MHTDGAFFAMGSRWLLDIIGIDCVDFTILIRVSNLFLLYETLVSSATEIGIRKKSVIYLGCHQQTPGGAQILQLTICGKMLPGENELVF